jgi:hypothetical protein
MRGRDERDDLAESRTQRADQRRHEQDIADPATDRDDEGAQRLRLASRS